MIQPDCFKQQVRHETYLSLPFTDNTHKISLGNESDAKRFDRKAPAASLLFAALSCGYPIQRGHGLRAKQHDCKSLFALSRVGAVLRLLNPLIFPDRFRQSLLSHFRGVSIAGAGLDIQHSRWIRHPQTVFGTGKLTYPSFDQSDSVRLAMPCFGGMDWEPSGLTAKPPLRQPVPALSCGCPIHPKPFRYRVLPTMTYSFLIAPQVRKVSELNHFNIIRCNAPSLKQARASFAGLPVAMLSRKPEGGCHHA